MLLSVIVPFYNVERYFEECLQRLSAMPADAAEILLVDDRGSDGSLEIARRFAMRYPQMRIVTREKNGGLSAARNTGFAEAVGEYVYYLDSDDLPDAAAILTLAEKAKAQRLDVAKARFSFLYDDTGRIAPGPEICETAVLSGDALFARQCADATYEPMVWQCVYRREFLSQNQLIMAEGLLFEDELFQTPALLAAKRAAAFSMNLLLYRQREGSIMASFAKSAAWCDSYLAVCRRLTALAAELPEGEAKDALRVRIGQIALSVGKNIPAYRLPRDVAAQAKDFLRKNLRELSGYALSCGRPSVRAQGLLLRVLPEAFLALYGAAAGKGR